MDVKNILDSCNDNHKPCTIENMDYHTNISVQYAENTLQTPKYTLLFEAAKMICLDLNSAF